MNELVWAERRAAIEDDVYDILLTNAGCGPFDGGCLVVARALQQIIGGEIVVLERAETGAADHAAVFVDDMLWDFDGPMNYMNFIARYQRNELDFMMARCGGFRSIKPGDLEDAPRSDFLVDQLSNIFRTILPEYEFSPRP
jgi:hypothetical protein